jgi:hypothetical protein
VVECRGIECIGVERNALQCKKMLAQCGSVQFCCGICMDLLWACNCVVGLQWICNAFAKDPYGFVVGLHWICY